MPAPMKASTFASERKDSRLRPHTPWPLVQPLPMRTPTPTSKPASTSSTGPAAVVGTGIGSASLHTAGARIKPAVNAMRTPCPMNDRRDSDCSVPPTMPAMPATRPTPRISSVALRPIIRPPSSDRPGVKWLKAMVIMSTPTMAGWMQRGGGTGRCPRAEAGASGLDVGPALLLLAHQFDHARRHVADVWQHVGIDQLLCLHGVLARDHFRAGFQRLGDALGHRRAALEHGDAGAEGDQFDVDILLAQFNLHVAHVVQRQGPLGRVVVAHLEHDLVLLGLRLGLCRGEARDQCARQCNGAELAEEASVGSLHGASFQGWREGQGP